MTTYTWNVDADGNWSTKGDWTPSGPPTTGADVVIKTKDFHTITYSTGSVTIDTLTVDNDAFVLSGGALTISAAATFGDSTSSSGGGTLTLSGGTLAFATPSTAGAVSIVYGAYTQTAGTLSIASGAEVDLDHGGSSAAGGFAVASGGVLNFDGTDFTITGGAYNIAGETEIDGGTVDFSAATITSFGSLLAIGAGELELGTKNATISGFSSADGTVDGSGTLTITGSATIENGAAQTGSGRTVVSGTTNLAAGGGLATLNLDGNRIFENTGTLTWSGGNIDMGFDPYNPSTGGGTIQNDSGGTFDIQSDDGVFNYAGTVAFNNAGLLEKTATIGTTRIGVVFTNTGTVSVQSGTLQFDDGGTSAASALAAGSAGTLAFGGGTFTVTGNAYDVAGGTEVDGATADFTAATITSLGNLLTISSGELLLGTNTTSINAYDGTGGTLDGSGTVTVTGAATLDGDTETGTGTTILEGATALSGSLTLGGRSLENKGTITWTGTGNIVLGTSGESGGTLVNEGGATLDLQSDASIIADSGTDTLVNAGLLEKTTLGGTSTIQAAFTNLGTVSIADGNLDLTGSAGLGGTIDIAGGARLLLTGTASFAGATVTGGGRVYAEGPTSITGLTVGESTVFEVTGTTTESSGTITLGDTEGDAAQLFVNTGGTFDITDNSGIAIGAGTSSTVTADHLFEKTGGSGTSTIAASITDSGTITATTGTLAFTGAKDYFAGAITGAGTVALDGTFMALDAGTSISVANLAIGGLVQLNLSLSDTGALGETGTIWLGQNTLTLSGADTISGSITGSNGTVSGSLVFSGGSDLLSTGASIAVSHWTISGGTTTIAATLHYLSTFSAGAAAINLDGGASLYLNGTSALDGTTIKGAGDLYVGGAASVSGIGVGGTAELSIAGTVTESGGSTALGSSGGGAAEIYILSGGTFDLADDSGVTSGGTGGSLIVNKGVIEKTAGTGTSTIATVIANYGTIEVTSGVLAIGSTLYGTGTDEIGANGTLKVSGSVSSAQTVEFSASSGKLTLADPSGNHLSFAGTIDGFAGADRIDLAGFGYVAGKPVWNQAAGTLTITAGTKQAVLDLGGTYTSANFVQSSDNNGGTVITFTGTTTAAPRYASDTMTNAAKTVFSAGNAPSVVSRPVLDIGQAIATTEIMPGLSSLIDHQAAGFEQSASASPYLDLSAAHSPAMVNSLRSHVPASFQIPFHQHF